MITEAEEAENDRRAATAVYQTALNTAKAEYDALQPQLTKLQERASQLKRLIWAASGLVGVEVEDKYSLIRPPGTGNATVHAGGPQSGHRYGGRR